MDLDSTVEITIGPYETYEDGLFGYKAAFEAFVTVTDPAGDRAAGELQGRAALAGEPQLPIPDEHKNLNRGSESPIRVVDEVYSAGDTRAGIQTIAFNLPNDERVREAKGSKKVLLRNVMNAKFDQILMPIAAGAGGRDQLGDLTAESLLPAHAVARDEPRPGSRQDRQGRPRRPRCGWSSRTPTPPWRRPRPTPWASGTSSCCTRAGRDYFPDGICRSSRRPTWPACSARCASASAKPTARPTPSSSTTCWRRGPSVGDATTGRFRWTSGDLRAGHRRPGRGDLPDAGRGRLRGHGGLHRAYGGMPPVLADGPGASWTAFRWTSNRSSHATRADPATAGR